MKLYSITIVIIAAFHYSLVAQSFSCDSKKESTAWTKKPFEHFVFVENVGQFDKETKLQINKIEYRAEIGGTDVYFSSDGLIYKYNKYKNIGEKEREERESKRKRGERKEIDFESEKPVSYYLNMKWIGSNNSTTISASELQTGFYTFPPDQLTGTNMSEPAKARCYKKITYKNLYPNIDVEYILPEKGGLKYTLILHPGADISMVKMNYPDARKLKTDMDGNIIIKSDFGDFIDHAPVSYSNSNEVISSFAINKNDVSFIIGDYNKSETLIIDPWQRVPNNINPRYVPHDVDYDLSGNVYVHGAESVALIFAVTQLGGPLILEKYNSAGVWQWTFSGVSASYYGDFSVDKATGTSYIVQGNGPTMVRKINSSGQQIASLAQFSSMDEYWRCEFDNCTQKLFIAGGGASTNSQAATIDASLTTFAGFPVLANQTRYQDILFMALDPSSPFCYMATPRNGTQPPSFHDQMIKCSTPNLFPPLAWGPISTGYTVYFEGTIPGGINGMVCGKDFLYTYQGGILKKWNKVTGAFIAQTTVAGSFGISVDECDNVYAGVNGVNGAFPSVIAFNPSLTQIATYPIALNGQIADIKIGPGDKLYASGIGFVSEIQLPKSFTVTSVNPTSCNSCDGSATVLPCSAPSNYTYLWSNGQTAQTATGLCPGKYAVTVSINCNPIYKDSVIIGGGNFALSATQTNVTCAPSLGNATVTPIGGTSPYTYNWSNGATTSNISGLGAGTYAVTVTDASNCKIVKAFTISQPSAILLNISSQGLCTANNATSTAIVSGGNAPYAYLWSNGQTTQTATGLNNNAIYTVTVTDINGCTASSTVKVSVVPATFSSSNITCATYGAASVTVSTIGIPYTYSWSTGQSYVNNSGNFINITVPGIYSVTVTDGNGCTVSNTFTITSSTPASAAFTYPSPICVGSTVTFSNAGSSGPGATYIWEFAAPPTTFLTGTTVNFTYTFLTAGNYSITHYVQDAAGCRAKLTETFTVSPCTGPTVIATGSSVCTGVCATVTSSGVGGTSPYTYLWSNGATTQNINPCPVVTTTYTVTITDTGGNTSTSTAVVTVNPAVTVTTSSTTITCSGGTNGSIIATGSSGTPGYTYNWSTGATGISTGSMSVVNLSAGNYSVVVTDSKGCTSTSTATIISPPPLVGQFTKGTASCIGCGCKEWIMVTAVGGTSPYSYSWPDGYANRYRNQLCTGTYTVNVKDKNGCSVDVSITAP